MDGRHGVADLVSLLRKAYSGELAAALAYRGHANSVRDPAERDRILEIEGEEYHHRDLVGGILARLGSAPSPAKDRRARAVGNVLAFLCHVTGHLLPMWGAGRLEKGNIREYEVAARWAVEAGRPEFVDCLLGMAEVEWEHEFYFRSRVRASPLARFVPIWAPPPPKSEIRASFERETGIPSTSPLPARGATVAVR